MRTTTTGIERDMAQVFYLAAPESDAVSERTLVRPLGDRMQDLLSFNEAQNHMLCPKAQACEHACCIEYTKASARKRMSSQTVPQCHGSGFSMWQAEQRHFQRINSPHCQWQNDVLCMWMPGT